MLDELDSNLLPTIFPLLLEIPGPAYGEVSAWWMGHHEIPPIVDDVEHIALVVRSVTLGGKQVARHSFVPVCNECVPNPTAEFTSN